jgi:hypothetical protein
MGEIIRDEITFSAIDTTYAALQTLANAPTRGKIVSISGRRDGSGGVGGVTVRIFEDASSEDLVGECYLELPGDGEMDVAAPEGPVGFGASALKVTAKDDTASGDDIYLIVRYESGLVA